MEELLQQYARQVNASFAVQDNHIWVLQAVVADLSSGQAKINERGELDFKHYYDAHHEKMLKLKAEAEAKEKAAEPKKPSEPAAEEFGGDYGESETGSENAEGQQEPGGPEELGDGRPEENAVPEVPQDDVAVPGQPG